MSYYQKRWVVEVNNTYLKIALGLGDFRQKSFEATQKWFAVVILAIHYPQYRLDASLKLHSQDASAKRRG